MNRVHWSGPDRGGFITVFSLPPGGQCSIGADTLAGRYSTGANKLADPLLICANTKDLFNHDLAIADDLTEFVILRAHK